MKSTLLASFLCVLSVLPACKKKDDGGNCGSYGGVVASNTYLFWIVHDFSCGRITVEVRDADGKVITPYQGIISYTASSAPECSNVNYGKYATFDLYQGKKYTYKASCTGKTWTGTIVVPCEQNQCENIQLQ